MVHFDQLPPKQGLYDPALEKDACGVGFMAELTGQQTRRTVADALKALSCLEHRGATGFTPDGEHPSGDGAGIMLGLPHDFLAAKALELGFALPAKGQYSVAMVFLPQGDATSKQLIEDEVRARGLSVLGWRLVPVDTSVIGRVAAECCPVIEQLFVTSAMSGLDLDRVIYTVRKRVSSMCAAYVCSWSSSTITYKGMLTTAQLPAFYTDLSDEGFCSHVALTHSRFSTNTFPSWSRAHPYRYMCHNGEINTLDGNKNWTRAREGMMQSAALPELSSCFPIIEPECSDSMAFDNMLELLVLAGRPLHEAVMMMIPEPWQNDPGMDPAKRAYYKYQSALIEPWDGPALVAFTNGSVLGIQIDRNGLRPCRYVVTKDQRIIGGSEAGCLYVPPTNVVQQGRLQAGKMFLVDLEAGQLLSDASLKEAASAKQPYQEWLEQSVTLSMLTAKVPAAVGTAWPDYEPAVDAPVELKEIDLHPTLKAAGFCMETLELLLKPMGVDAVEALGSMGNDSALAVLSTQPRSCFDYFKQMFAQVTNPPIDPIRESVVMSLACFVGPEQNLLSETPLHARRLFLETPLLTQRELQAVQQSRAGWGEWWRGEKHALLPRSLDATFPRSAGPEGLAEALARLRSEASAAVEGGVGVLVLTDRRADLNHCAVPCLLALGAVHHHLVQLKQRTRCALIVDAAEPREVHHVCVLTGYGADAVCPYGAYAALAKLGAGGRITGNADAEHKYRTAAGKGVLKVMAKMGISTLMSYKGAQVFEAVGLGAEVVQGCFVGTPSRVGGASLAHLASSALRMHNEGYPAGIAPPLFMEIKTKGLFHDRHIGGEAHLNDPDTIAALQNAARSNSREAYATFAKLHQESIQRCTLRGQLDFVGGTASIPLEEVESVASIVKRFRTGAMSYGSISSESHEALAVAMNQMGGKSNTGEGGEHPSRFTDNRRSSIKQVASGRFGVNIAYLTNADELQIKMAQGAKPGEGGELPGHKVDATIAACRGSTVGVGLISPPPHHDIYSIEDLAELIFDLKNVNPTADVSVKLVSKAGVGVIAAGVAKGKADHILIAGHDGGTGASRWTGIKHAGLPWELGIAETHQTLVLNGLRGQVSLETDGILRTGRDVVLAACLGAEQFGFATAPLIALGCIMMRKCHLNTCPVGIATQDPELRAKFKGEPEHVVNYLFMVAEEARVLMAQLGVRSIDELVGRSDLLEQTRFAHGLDLSGLLAPNAPGDNHKVRRNVKPASLDDEVCDGIVRALAGKPDSLVKASSSHPDVDSMVAAVQMLQQGVTVRADLKVSTLDRALGTTLSHQLTKAGWTGGAEGAEAVHLKCAGYGGQSVGAWLAPGITLELKGEANDYVGKGLSGGTLVVYPPKGLPEPALVGGNVCFYGATSGKAFLRGLAGERFCVRNSGVNCVVEGIGDHGCEYMTGGRVVILGSTGANFAAGMSGGLAFVYDPERSFAAKCNMGDVDLVPVGGDQLGELKQLLEEHVQATGSPKAQQVLEGVHGSVLDFTVVFPRDYRKALLKEQEKAHLASYDGHPGMSAATLSTKAGSGTNLSRHSWNTSVGQSSSVGSQSVGDMADFVEPVADAVAGTPPKKTADLEDIGGRPTAVEKPVRGRGFLAYERANIEQRDAAARIQDFEELNVKPRVELSRTQASRCMDCGVPFCQQPNRSMGGCPLGNKIPEWNKLVRDGEWRLALDRLLETNNFPEFTGRVCPAPCESSCTLGIIDKPVAIKSVEASIIDRAFQEGWMVPQPPSVRTGKRVAILGSGPCGMAAADQLNKVGHAVTVYERADRPGGLLMYGVPNMKADKKLVVNRRCDLMRAEGVEFVCGPAGEVGGAGPSPTEVYQSFDAVVCATGATKPRDLPIEGRQLEGVRFAMEYLKGNTSHLLDTGSHAGCAIHAKGKKVIVIGGGDTGNDCLGTAMRHGAESVLNFEVMPKAPLERAANNPWPQWSRTFKTDYGHEEVATGHGADPRIYSILSKRFVGVDGKVTGVDTVRVQFVGGKMEEIPGSEEHFPCDLVFLAMGFLGPEAALIKDLDLGTDARSNIQASFGPGGHQASGKVFAAGDCRRGQSLVVWAIREGREAAREVDTFLMGKSNLP